MPGVVQKMLGPITLTNGSATPITSVSNTYFATSIIFQAPAANVGEIYYGNASCTTSNGIAIQPDEEMIIKFDQVHGVTPKIDLASIYFDAAQTGDKVRLIYMDFVGF